MTLGTNPQCVTRFADQLAFLVNLAREGQVCEITLKASVLQVRNVILAPDTLWSTDTSKASL